MKDRERFKRRFATLAAAFGVDLDPFRTDAYWEALSDLTDDQFDAAVHQSISSLKWMPKPVELREAALGKQEDRALLAQRVLEKAITDHGAYASVDFEDQAINAAVRAVGGWIAVCQTDAGEWRKFRSREFKQAYAVYAARPTETKHLVGIYEQSNAAFGHVVEGPRRIGCPELVAGPRRLGPGGEG